MIYYLKLEKDKVTGALKNEYPNTDVAVYSLGEKTSGGMLLFPDAYPDKKHKSYRLLTRQKKKIIMEHRQEMFDRFGVWFDLYDLYGKVEIE